MTPLWCHVLELEAHHWTKINLSHARMNRNDPDRDVIIIASEELKLGTLVIAVHDF